MPGGQYTNLYQQAQALGMTNTNFLNAAANRLLGDIIKVGITHRTHTLL